MWALWRCGRPRCAPASTGGQTPHLFWQAVGCIWCIPAKWPRPLACWQRWPEEFLPLARAPWRVQPHRRGGVHLWTPWSQPRPRRQQRQVAAPCNSWRQTSLPSAVGRSVYRSPLACYPQQTAAQHQRPGTGRWTGTRCGGRHFWLAARWGGWQRLATGRALSSRICGQVGRRCLRCGSAADVGPAASMGCLRRNNPAAWAPESTPQTASATAPPRRTGGCGA
mmetsp:Transcript_108356/g.334701  ORF Transcript_108356/g.334701 Transcript_108356/m.334701 type:complete len:223 (-) Transcript_108356:87-755(-)